MNPNDVLYVLVIVGVLLLLYTYYCHMPIKNNLKIQALEKDQPKFPGTAAVTGYVCQMRALSAEEHFSQFVITPYIYLNKSVCMCICAWECECLLEVLDPPQMRLQLVIS